MQDKDKAVAHLRRKLKIATKALLDIYSNPNSLSRSKMYEILLSLGVRTFKTPNQPVNSSDIHLPIMPGATVNYSDFQFGNLDGAVLKHIQVHTAGIYAVLFYDGETYTVPYRNISLRE